MGSGVGRVTAAGALPGPPTVFCFACGSQIDARAELCPRCGVRQPTATPVGWAVPQTQGGKDRVVAIILALLLGGLGVHKFYLGKVAQGVIYLIFCWTFIPSLVAWIESLMYLTTSDEAWAAKWGGPVGHPSSGAIGCLWAIALLPLLSIVAIVALIFLGGQVSVILSRTGTGI